MEGLLSLIWLVVGIMLVVSWPASRIQLESFEHAIEVCKTNSGLDYIQEDSGWQSKAVCVNGAVFKYNNRKLDEKENKQ